MQGPRRLAFILPLLLAATSLASAATYFTESPVTLQLTLHTTSQPTRTEADAEGRVIEETTIAVSRLGNADLLAEMARRSLIPAARGHVVVAVWANWPDEKPFAGSAFRLFVRPVGAGQGALVRVPHEVFGITPEDWLHERDVLRRSGALKSGKSRYEAYSGLAISLGGASGTLLGRDEGAGVFKSPIRSSGLQYLPEPSAMSLEGTAGGHLCSGQISFGKARFIPDSHFKPNALPKKTTPGGVYGFSASMRVSESMNWGWWMWEIPPFVHYFCPLTVDLELRWQESVSSPQKGRSLSRIATDLVSNADLVRGLLEERGVTDTEGWGLYLHEQSNDYTSLADMDLVLAHPDGRIVEIRSWQPIFNLSSARAAKTRREYVNGTYASGVSKELAHVTHERSWRLPEGATLSVLATGFAEIESRHGLIPEAEQLRKTQPQAAEATLFGSYSKANQSGLVSVTLQLGAPLLQSQIPAGWGSLFPPYSPPDPSLLRFGIVRVR